MTDAARNRAHNHLMDAYRTVCHEIANAEILFADDKNLCTNQTYLTKYRKLKEQERGIRAKISFLALR